MSKTIEDITNKEVERYIRLQDFVIGRTFIAVMVIAMAVGYTLLTTAGLALVGAILLVSRFILFPIFTNIMAPITRKHDPEGYKQFLEFKKKEYIQKYYS